ASRRRSNSSTSETEWYSRAKPSSARAKARRSSTTLLAYMGDALAIPFSDSVERGGHFRIVDELQQRHVRQHVIGVRIIVDDAKKYQQFSLIHSTSTRVRMAATASAILLALSNSNLTSA